MFSMSKLLLLACAAVFTAPAMVAALAQETGSSSVARMGSMSLARRLKVSAVEGSMQGYGTWFTAMGTPFGGCGVPPEKAKDDNGLALPFVALNTNSEFQNGANCGRWIRIVVGDNCQGGGNADWSVCNGGSFGPDKYSGTVMYGYTMDSCADQNVWCQNDSGHLDISEDHLHRMGLREGSTFNARKLSWDYISYVPDEWAMASPKFMWMEGSRWIGHQFWATIIIYNIPNGIGKVEQRMPESMGGNWVEIPQLTNLGNNYELKRPCVEGHPVCTNTSIIHIRVTGKSGDMYGAWEVTFTGGGDVINPSQDAPAKLIE